MGRSGGSEELPAWARRHLDDTAAVVPSAPAPAPHPDGPRHGAGRRGPDRLRGWGLAVVALAAAAGVVPIAVTTLTADHEVRVPVVDAFPAVAPAPLDPPRTRVVPAVPRADPPAVSPPAASEPQAPAEPARENDRATRAPVVPPPSPLRPAPAAIPARPTVVLVPAPASAPVVDPPARPTTPRQATPAPSPTPEPSDDEVAPRTQRSAPGGGAAPDDGSGQDGGVVPRLLDTIDQVF